jgi:anti-sigma factor RsiW
MACAVCSETIDAYVDSELPPAEASALAAHLRTSAACAADALERVRMKRSIAVAGKRYQPSAQFRERIAQSIAAKPEPAKGGWHWRILAAPALLVLLISLGVNIYVKRDSAQRERVYSELADLHVAALAGTSPVDVVSSDRHTVKPWFQGKLPFTFNLPELQGTDFTLVGGRMTYFGQTPGAHLIYQVRKHLISVFIFQDRDVDTASLRPGPVTALSFHTETWMQNGLRYFVVGDAGDNDIEALSNLLRDAK